jgi:hypothetical protein
MVDTGRLFTRESDMVQQRVKPYTKEFREEVLKPVESSDKPISEIERERYEALDIL